MTREHWIGFFLGAAFHALLVIAAIILAACSTAHVANPQESRHIPQDVSSDAILPEALESANPSALRANRCEGRYPPDWCPR